MASVSSAVNTSSVGMVGPKDTTFTKIFVGGLPYHTTDQSLREFFQQFGDIDEAVVITDRQTTKSKGYGFVTMTDKDGADRACADPNPIIDGRKANVNLAYLGAKPRVIPSVPQVYGSGLQTNLGAAAGLMGQAPVLGMPQLQYVLTPAGYVAVPTTVPSPSAQSPTSAVTSTSSPVVAASQMGQGPLFDFSAAGTTGVTNVSAAQLQGVGLDAAAQIQAAAAARYISNPSVAAYYAYTAPQLVGRATTQYQSQQIQERMQ